MTAVDLPYLSESQLENAAHEVLHAYALWKGAPPRPPIPIDEIVEGLLGLSLSFVDLRARYGLHDVLGMLRFDERSVMVDESVVANEGRYAFTLAHEVGHWVLHRGAFAREIATNLLDLPGSLEGAAPTIVCRDLGQDRIEVQANKFAAYLLMPSADVLAAVDRARKTPSFLRLPIGDGPSDELLAVECITQGGFSNVSHQAMVIRIKDLRLDRDESSRV